MPNITLTQEQLEALISSKVSEATRGLQDRLTSAEKNRDAIKREKDSLLGKRRSDKLTTAVDTYIKTGNWDHVKSDAKPDRIVIPRGASPQEYRQLKAHAQKMGVPYEVAFDAPTHSPRVSKVKYVETDLALYVNREQQRRLGVQRLLEMAQQKGKRLIAFRDVDDLPAEARAKHDRIVQAGDPDAFVFEDGEG
jgi:hypothetical protein